MDVYEATYVLRDREGNVGTCRAFHRADGFPFSAVETWAFNLAAAISAISDAQIGSFTITRAYEVSHSLAVPGSDITDTLVCVVRPMDDYHTVILFPTLQVQYQLLDVYGAPLYVVDMTRPEVQALAAALVAPPACDRWGYPLIEVVEMGTAQ